MKLYTVYHTGCGQTRMFETFNKVEAEAYIENHFKGYEQNCYICEQGNDEQPIHTMRTAFVTFENGDTITTNINGTDEEIKSYYIGKYFQFGDTEEHPHDLMIKAISCEVK